MSYLSTAQVQAWLQKTKYKISSVESDFEIMAKEYIFGQLSQRYDISLWTNGTNTPALVMHLLAMQVASYELRRAGSEEDGRTTYADYLDKRVADMISGILSGSTILIGVPEIDLGLGAGPEFFPAEGSELLDPTDINFAPRYFTMGQLF